MNEGKGLARSASASTHTERQLCRRGATRIAILSSAVISAATWGPPASLIASPLLVSSVLYFRATGSYIDRLILFRDTRISHLRRMLIIHRPLRSGAKISAYVYVCIRSARLRAVCYICMRKTGTRVHFRLAIARRNESKTARFHAFLSSGIHYRRLLGAAGLLGKEIARGREPRAESDRKIVWPTCPLFAPVTFKSLAIPSRINSQFDFSLSLSLSLLSARADNT